MKILFALLVSSLILTGCHSYDVNSSRPVRYANGVKVLEYDHTQRAPSPTIQIFDRFNPAPAHYVALASLSRMGYLQDESLIDNALTWRARQLGANGIILLPPEQSDYSAGFAIANANGGFATGGSSQPVFRAVAILIPTASTPN